MEKVALLNTLDSLRSQIEFVLMFYPKNHDSIFVAEVDKKLEEWKELANKAYKLVEE